MVPLDGFVRIRYHGRIPDGPVFVEEVSAADGSTTPVTGQLNVVPATTPADYAEVHYKAPAFRQFSRYRVTFPDITGGGASNRFEFTTGTLASGDTPPMFYGLNGAPVLDSNGENDLCGEPDALTVSLRWTRAVSAWPIGDIEYIVYQTRGENIAGPVERARERGRLVSTRCADPGPDGMCVSFRMTAASAVTPMCFNVQAVDAFGHADGNREERCVDPEPGARFVGCSASPNPPHRPLGWLLITASVTVAAVGVSRVVSRRKR